MRKLTLLVLLIIGGCFNSGCIDFKKAGSDAANGALLAVEKRVDEKLQSVAAGLETKVEGVKASTAEELEKRGWNPETIALISTVITGLGGAATNYLRNKKYTDLPWWKKMFTGGGASRMSTVPIAPDNGIHTDVAEPPKPQV